MFRKLQIDQDDLQKGLIVISIIVTVSAIFLPIIIIYILQDVFYFSRDYWFRTTPTSAYVIFIGGMLMIPVASVLYMIIKYVMDKKNMTIRIGWIFVIISLAVIPMSALGVMNYYYLDDNGVHYNHTLQTSETSYLWEEIIQIQPYSDEDNNQYFSHFTLTTQDGRQVDMPASHEFLQYRQIVFQIVEDHGGEVLDRIEES
ncbi:hypothetical protein CR194_06490 [Salipaludibacillus keqinensis]|uniref:Uncharacterized protein n=1 Tax=Salipaludibacillus keqinensis TaxID=2045207 RepID=A0A323TJU8_9BACI|nr:hypothetical protein [Salipaludibacillus keqinensis]PYZ95158.1 hypothetical protein CR194_06490 [Salipaludibacillus keqinensis]